MRISIKIVIAIQLSVLLLAISPPTHGENMRGFQEVFEQKDRLYTSKNHQERGLLFNKLDLQSRPLNQIEDVFEVYFEAMWYWDDNKRPEALSFAEEVYKKINQSSKLSSIAKTYSQGLMAKFIAIKYQSIFQHATAAKWYYKAASHYENTELWLEAVEFSFQASSLQYSARNHSLLIPVVKNNIDLMKANKVEGDEVLRKLRNHYNLLGLAYQGLKDYDSSLIAYENALSYATQLDHSFWMALIKGNMGVVYFMIGEYEKAIPNLLEDFRMSKLNREWESAANAAVAIARTYGKMGKSQLMKDYLDSAHVIVEANDLFFNKASLYKEIANYYKSKGQYQEALAYMEKHQDAKDSISTVQNTKGLSELKLKFDFEKGLEELDFLQKENELKEKQYKQSKIIIFTLMGFIVLLILQGIVLFNTSNKLKKLNFSLDAIVKARTKDLEIKNQQLETYLYHASHEIRRPITSLIGLFTLGQTSENLEEKNHFFHLAQQVGHKMDQMLLKIHYLYQLEKSLTLSACDVSRALVEANKKVAMRLFDKKIDVSFSYNDEENWMIHSNEEFLQVAFEYLIENAYQFSDRNKEKAKLTIDLFKLDGKIHLKFSDNGIGIPQSLQNRLFQSFEKLSESSEGNGLGLFICKKIIHKLKGEIHIASQFGEGTEVSIILPENSENEENIGLMVEEQVV